MAIGSVLFFAFAIVGLILLILGIVFVVKNVKWKKEKEEQGLSTTGNIVAIVLFSLMIFFGLMWLVGFGIGGLVFLLAF